jgi:hypothetical protein
VLERVWPAACAGAALGLHGWRTRPRCLGPRLGARRRHFSWIAPLPEGGTLNAHAIFRSGQQVRARSTGTECTVEELLGGGAQGEVYRVRNALGALALKWYYPASATERQLSLIAKLIYKGPPDSGFL